LLAFLLKYQHNLDMCTWSWAFVLLGLHDTFLTLVYSSAGGTMHFMGTAPWGPMATLRCATLRCWQLLKEDTHPISHPINSITALKWCNTLDEYTAVGFPESFSSVIFICRGSELTDGIRYLPTPTVSKWPSAPNRWSSRAYKPRPCHLNIHYRVIHTIVSQFDKYALNITAINDDKTHHMQD